MKASSSYLDLPLNKREFRKVLFRALLFPLLSAFLLALLIAWQIKALLDMTTWVHRSQQVIAQSHRVQKLLIDMETGILGYSLTGNKTYLDPYEEARYELDSALTKIKSLLDEQSNEKTKVAKVEALTKEWIVRYSDVTIDRLSAGKKAFDFNIGRSMMDEMRTELSELIQEATEKREERVQRAETMARVLSGGGVLLAISIGFFLALSARRHILQLTILYQQALDERNHLLSQETHRSQQLQALAELAIALNTTVKLEDRLEIVTAQARQIIGTHQAVTSITKDSHWSKMLHATSFSEKYRRWVDYHPLVDGSNLYAFLGRQNRAFRLTQKELSQHYIWKDIQAQGQKIPPLRGWLVAPLIGQDGKTLGVVQLSDKFQGDFTAEDEFILVQLAQVAAVAVENARLFEAQQEAVRTRDEFLSIASHELKTPLTSLRLQIQLMEKAIKTKEIDKIYGYSKQSLKSMDRITHLVDDMLDISHISAGRLSLQKEQFDLTHLAHEVVERLTPLAQQSACTLKMEPSGPIWGEWDRFRMDQVITNLVANAIKYGAGTPITVRVGKVGNQALVEIQDNGIGIAKEHHERIFQRFERISSSQSVSGMGLGLYITRQIVDMHEGNLELESELGKGALFRVRLPASNPS